MQTAGTEVSNDVLPGGSSAAASQKENVEHLLRALAEPFNPGVVKWVVTATTSGAGGKKRGLVAPYADPRAYIDRLNVLFTPAGWTNEYDFEVIQNCPRKTREGVSTSVKVMVVCRVTIHGIGTHAGTGEEWAGDDNAVTGSDAQAFKRACACFGLGRYLYGVPQLWVDLDDRNLPVSLPNLPNWALPNGNKEGNGRRAVSSSDRAQVSSKASAPSSAGAGNAQGKSAAGRGSESNGAGKEPGFVAGKAEGAANRRALVSEFEQLSKSAGRKMTASVLASTAGVASLEEITDPGKLLLAMERLRNAARGVERLRAALQVTGLERFRQVCEELKLPWISTQEIPDTKVLREMVERVEAAARAVSKDGTAAGNGEKASGEQGEVIELRDRFLSLARRFSLQRKRSIQDVVSWASAGTLTYAQLSGLTQTNLPALRSAVSRLMEGRP
ncbi:MAG: Rad52/Rad22 family DNA repair protein [Candidatus Acidiferrales bacterium]